MEAEYLLLQSRRSSGVHHGKRSPPPSENQSRPGDRGGRVDRRVGETKWGVRAHGVLLGAREANRTHASGALKPSAPGDGPCPRAGTFRPMERPAWHALAPRPL